MKLISLYIDNFGGLSGYALEFSDGVTVIQAPNGFGKTTLAEFIRAMFYGFPRKGKFLEKDRRQRYTPWNGAKAGGNLVFELDGIRYRIERTFGAEPRGDTFKLMDLSTGRKSDRFSKEIGAELFQLDADSFERSTYMLQLSEQSGLTTAGIQAKLSDLVEDANDVGNFDKAMAALKSKRSTLIPYRGSGGTVAEAAFTITKIQQELDLAQTQKERLELCRAEIVRLEADLERSSDELGSVREQIRLASEAAARAAVRLQHQDLASRHQKVSEEIRAIQARYPLGIPSDSETEAAGQAADRLAVLTAQEVTTQSDREAAAFAEENQQRFEGRLPSSGELEEYRQKSEAYTTLLTRIGHASLSVEERRQYDTLRPVFESGQLDEGKLDAIAEQTRQLLKLKTAAENLTADPEESRQLLLLQSMPEKRLSPMPLTLLLVLAVSGICTGIALLVMKHVIFGGIGLGIGILVLIAGIFSGMRLLENRRKIEADREKLRSLQEKNRILEEKQAGLHSEIENLDSRLQRELKHWFKEIPDYDRAIAHLRLVREKFLDLQSKKQASEETARSLTAQADGLREELAAYLGSYFEDVEPSRFGMLLSALQRDSEHYLRARSQTEQWRERQQQHETDSARCHAELDAFFRRYGLEAGDIRQQLQQIRRDRQLLEDSRLRKAQLGKQLEIFRAEHEAVLSAPAEEIPDPELLKQREKFLSNRITDVTAELLARRQECQTLQARVDLIPHLGDELAQWQEKKTGDQEKAKTLDDTMDFLQKAKDSLSTSYLGPIRESFDRYLERLMGQKEQILVSPDLDVQLERQGQAREMAYFSAGQTDLVTLCMRLALVDALFREKKPFVILDDPFVNLDDERTAEALALLKELGKDRQILYLTCNSSRSI